VAEVIRLVVVDDHAIVRQGLRSILEREDDVREVGEAATADEALNLVARERPDIVLLDLKLSADSDTAGLALCGAIMQSLLRNPLADPYLLGLSSGAALGAVSFLLAGFALLIADAGAALLFVAIALIGLGLGIAMPGYTAGLTLLMRREEQGGLAGLIGATNGLTFVIAPTLGTALYGVWPPLPIMLGAMVMAAVAAFVLLHPRFRG